MPNKNLSSQLFERGVKIMPGGVNSPVRSFKAVGREPIFIQSARGSKIFDADGKGYIDYVCSWGPMILGHGHPEIERRVVEAVKGGLSFGAPTEREVQMAELITEMVPNVEMVRMVNSGTEAVMSALRLARGFTGKEKIIKFEGCYHGHSDSMLVSAGSGALTLSTPNSKGVTEAQTRDTLIAQYNDLKSVEELFAANHGNVAAIIVEPVAANMGVVMPEKGFLEGLRTLCDSQRALLIFDEVITGFRLAMGGAQEFFGVKADIVTLGKIIGGGMPVGAYGARREIMSEVAPLGGVYQAGTLSGNPVAMAAGLAELEILRSSPEIYSKLDDYAKKLSEGFRNAARAFHAPISVNQVGSLMCPFFTPTEVRNFAGAKTSDTRLYAKFFSHMLDSGINLAPAQFEAMFISGAHSSEDLKLTLDAVNSALKQCAADGDF